VQAVAHGVSDTHHAVTTMSHVLNTLPRAVRVMNALLEPILNRLVGMVAGALTLAAVTMAGWVSHTDR
jgi:predicted DNA repair protein MutK